LRRRKAAEGVILPGAGDGHCRISRAGLYSGARAGAIAQHLDGEPLMKLWLFDCDAPREDIEAACTAAAALIEGRGVSVEQAYDAVMKRSNRERFDRRAAQAWDDAEDEALEVLYPGEEAPTEPVLGPAEDVD
jgi:hypothetical protein